MATNYQFEQDADGTYTVKDFEIFQLGRWYGHGGPENGLEVGESELASVLQADAVHHDLIGPNIRRLHPVQGGGQEILGFLGRFRRAGNKILADIKGMTADVFAEFKSGKLGRQSPIVRMNWTEPSTSSLLPMSIPHLDFIGGAMPAITSLKPAVSFSDEAAVTITLTGFVPLEKAGQISLSGFAKAAQADNKTEVATMTDANESERLARKAATDAQKITDEATIAMAEATKAHETQMAEQRDAIHKERVDAFISNWMTKIPPAEVEQVKTVAMALRDLPFNAFCDGIKARPDVEAKNTKGSGAGSGEEIQAEDKLIAMAEDLVDKKGISFGDAVASLRPDAEMWAEFRKPYAGMPEDKS